MLVYVARVSSNEQSPQRLANTTRIPQALLVCKVLGNAKFRSPRFSLGSLVDYLLFSFDSTITKIWMIVDSQCDWTVPLPKHYDVERVHVRVHVCWRILEFDGKMWAIAFL